jgi:hypothetical protein
MPTQQQQRTQQRRRPRRTGRTADAHKARQAASRRAAALEGLTSAIEHADALKIPPPLTQIRRRKHGVAPTLNVQALELARQVYYLHHGSLADAARAIIAAGLSDTPDVTHVRDRLGTWWARERWPKRPLTQTFAIRDANHDGGLYRSKRSCIGSATGNGPAPKGATCPQSPLLDSEYCFHHDPREKYVKARQQQARRLAESRSYDMVALEPFRRWMDRERRRLLAQARGKVHPNNTGWGLLATELGIDLSVIGRMRNGTHNGAATRKGAARTGTITVANRLRPVHVPVMWQAKEPRVKGVPRMPRPAGPAVQPPQPPWRAVRHPNPAPQRCLRQVPADHQPPQEHGSTAAAGRAQCRDADARHRRLPGAAQRHARREADVGR